MEHNNLTPASQGNEPVTGLQATKKPRCKIYFKQIKKNLHYEIFTFIMQTITLLWLVLVPLFDVGTGSFSVMGKAVGQIQTIGGGILGLSIGMMGIMTVVYFAVGVIMGIVYIIKRCNNAKSFVLYALEVCETIRKKQGEKKRWRKKKKSSPFKMIMVMVYWVIFMLLAGGFLGFGYNGITGFTVWFWIGAILFTFSACIEIYKGELNRRLRERIITDDRSKESATVFEEYSSKASTDGSVENKA